MANIFTSVSARTPKRHKFKLNHECKLTGEMGQLLPIFCQDVLPGDRFKVGTSQLIRFAPMLAPVMSAIDAYVHFFFVPNRIIWKDWETFITGSRNGKKLAEEEVPVQPRLMVAGNWLNKSPESSNLQKFFDGIPYCSNGSLIDYLQFPTTNETKDRTLSYPIDELPLRAYQRIYFDWYRDENLSDFDDFEIIDNDKFNNGDNYLISDGQNEEYFTRANLLMRLQRRAWKKDYFTSALPFAQKGDDVLIPGTLSNTNIKGDSFVLRNSDSTQGQTFNISGEADTVLKNLQAARVSASQPYARVLTEQGKNLYLAEGAVQFNINDIASHLSLDSSNISAGTIRELRRAMAAQRFLEREAVGGTRYIEQILSFFGVKSSDARLQRAEFLGGSKQPIVVSQVLQTSESTQNSPLGQPAGNAVSGGGKFIFDRTFEEHGWIIGLLSVIPRAEYMDGYPRKYMKRDRFDYYWPQFARIGEQEIKRSELKYNFGEPYDSGANNETFGYTPRYAEYRFINSHVHGDFRDSLDFWTLARRFESQPLLNESFIECNPSQRIFAYDNTDNENVYQHLWMQVGFNVSALRPLPKYGESI